MRAVTAARRRLTFSNVTAASALFIALGGTGYAALELPSGSVGNAQLRKGAVTTAKVRDRSLTARDFKPGALPTGERGPAGERGPVGERGPAGPAGAAGPRGERGPAFGNAITDASAQIPPCEEAEVVKLDLTLTEPARLFASAQLAVKLSSQLSQGTASVRVERADGTEVARTADHDGFKTADLQPIPLAPAGVVVAGNADGSPPAILQPGEYRVRLMAMGGNGSCGGGPVYVNNAHLSYVVLGA